VTSHPVRRVEIAGMSVWYGERAAVQSVSLKAPAGQVTALLGPNGAGKSSLVAAIAGAAVACAGTLGVDGKVIPLGRPDLVRRAGVAVVPEGHRVLRDMTVEDNLRVASVVHPRAERAGAIDDALSTFPELGKLRRRNGGLLSGGEQQMLALAQALVSRPRYVIIDELSLGLSPALTERLAQRVDELARGGVGVLLIEQFTALALALASRAYLLSRGRISPRLDPRELRDRPELLHRAYLAASRASMESTSNGLPVDASPDTAVFRRSP
jgi:branched-chain amino acid transport system ATP-binding protein